MILNKKIIVTLSLLASLLSAISVLYLGSLTIKITFALLGTFFILTHNKSREMIGLLIVFCVLFTPKFSAYGVSTRIDDYITIMMAICLLSMVFKKGENPPLVKEISFYLIYCLLITIVNLSLNHLRVFYLFYFLKEIQYFVYFFFFVYAVKKIGSELFIRYIRIFFIFTYVYGIYQIALGKMMGFYGIGLISETGPSQTGGVFFLMTFFFLYLFNTKKKTTDLMLFLLGIFLTISTVSRTAMMAMVVSLTLYFIIMLFNSKKLSRNIIPLIIIIFVGAFLLWGFSKIVPDELKNRIEKRVTGIDQGTEIRVSKWSLISDQVNLKTKFFGGGKGFAQEITGGTTLATDSQYLRLIIETGYLGIALWLIVILKMLLFCKKYWNTYRYECTYILILITGYLTMSITHEVFLVTIQASIFWIMCGLIMGKVERQKYEG